jgi:hypothetical protein
VRAHRKPGSSPWRAHKKPGSSSWAPTTAKRRLRLTRSSRTTKVSRALPGAGWRAEGSAWYAGVRSPPARGDPRLCTCACGGESDGHRAQCWRVDGSVHARREPVPPGARPGAVWFDESADACQITRRLGYTMRPGAAWAAGPASGAHVSTQTWVERSHAHAPPPPLPVPDVADDYMSSKVAYVNNDILTDCVLAKDFKV